MKSIELEARAKINLSLDVLKKRPDGYHEVKMIMQEIGLCDNIFIEKTYSGIEISSNCPWVPSDASNTAYKAAELIMDKYNLQTGIRIKIDKRIPVAAGLAGGSADAAAIIKGLNQLFTLDLEQQEMLSLGKQIGADVPFCIKGGTMLAEGIGEILTELCNLTSVSLVLVKPKISVSTAWVYKNLCLESIMDRPDTDKLISAVKKKDLITLAENMRNVLETVTVPKYGIINEIKTKLCELGAIGSMMSGSGPTVFGIFSDGKTAQNAYWHLKSGRWDCFLTTTYGEM